MIEVGKRLVLISESEKITSGRIPITLLPGFAYGYWQPDTLRMLEKLEEIPPGQRVLDMGTGAGTLAIAAAKLGAREVWATEYNLETIPLAASNIAVNDVDVKLHQTDTLPEGIGQVDVVVSNIGSPERVQDYFESVLAPDGVLILGLNDDSDVAGIPDQFTLLNQEDIRNGTIIAEYRRRR